MHPLPEPQLLTNAQQARLEALLEIHIQPIVDPGQQIISACEALIRTRPGMAAGYDHFSRTTLTAALIAQTGRLKAIRHMRQMGIRGYLHLSFFPRDDLEPERCLEEILQTAEHGGIPQAKITLVFRENHDAGPRKRLQEILGYYRFHGFRTALQLSSASADSVRILADARPDYVKLERALFGHMSSHPEQHRRLRNLARLCHNNAISLIASEVENAGEVQLLQEAGVRFFQGSHFAEPARESLPEILW